MEYSIRQLSQLAGVSARTLRYYDQIGLLAPLRTSRAGYRCYGEKEVALLQQILFYRERGLKLEQIAEILYQPGFDAMAAMEEHLNALKEQQEHTARLIASVQKTIEAMKGKTGMSDMERFEAFRRELVEENDKKYGKEVRERYGDMSAEAANRKMLHMAQEEYERFRELEKEIYSRLTDAVKEGEDPEGEAGRQIALLHREWIEMTWERYDVAAHRELTGMYVADARFTGYYDKETAGCAAFLDKAVKRWI